MSNMILTQIPCTVYQWCSQHKILGGGKMFDFKRAAVFCKQVSSFSLAIIFIILPTYSNRLLQGNVFNHITWNLLITKNNTVMIVCDSKDKKCKMKKKIRSLKWKRREVTVYNNAIKERKTCTEKCTKFYYLK